MIDKTGLKLLLISIICVFINIYFWVESSNPLNMFAMGFSSAFAVLSVVVFYLVNKDKK